MYSAASVADEWSKLKETLVHLNSVPISDIHTKYCVLGGNVQLSSSYAVLRSLYDQVYGGHNRSAVYARLSEIESNFRTLVMSMYKKYTTYIWIQRAQTSNDIPNEMTLCLPSLVQIRATEVHVLALIDHMCAQYPPHSSHYHDLYTLQVKFRTNYRKNLRLVLTFEKNVHHSSPPAAVAAGVDNSSEVGGDDATANGSRSSRDSVPVEIATQQ